MRTLSADLLIIHNSSGGPKNGSVISVYPGQAQPLWLQPPMRNRSSSFNLASAEEFVSWYMKTCAA